MTSAIASATVREAAAAWSVSKSTAARRLRDGERPREAPVSDHDWRLMGQQKYLTGATLVRRRWRQSRPHWDHDHCEFCGAKFADDRLADALHEGWTTPDEYRWICDGCFHDFRERFGWNVHEDPN